MLRPSVEQVIAGAGQTIGIETSHYIAGKDTRCPKTGGFMSYTHKMAEGADLRLNTPVSGVDFSRRTLHFPHGSTTSYDNLVSTMFLKRLIGTSIDAPPSIRVGRRC